MDEEGVVAAMNWSELGEASLPIVGGANVYMDYMHRFQTLYMDSKKKIVELEKENLELKQRVEMEEDRRENMQMEILIVKGDLNLERNQRVSLEEKLRFITETLWKDRDRDSAAKGTNSCDSDSTTSKNPRPSSPNYCDSRSLKENHDVNLVVKEKHNKVASASHTSLDELSNLLDSLTSSSSKKARLEDSPVVASELNNTRSSRRAGTPKATATVAPTRKSLRRLSAVAKQMEKEEPKKPPPQGNPKRKNDQKSSVNCSHPDNFVTQPQTRKRPKEKQIDLKTEYELPSNRGSQEFLSYPEGFLPPPTVVDVGEPKETSSEFTTVKIQSTNNFVQALQKIMGARAEKK